MTPEPKMEKAHSMELLGNNASLAQSHIANRLNKQRVSLQQTHRLGTLLTDLTAESWDWDGRRAIGEPVKAASTSSGS